MTRIFFFVAVGALVYLLSRGCTKEGGLSLKGVILPDSVTKAAEASPVSGAPIPSVMDGKEVRKARPVSEPEEKEAFVIGSYEFRNRVAPSIQWDTTTTAGSFVIVTGQNWIWRLPLADAASLAILAEKLDRARRSYSVQAVAVAVSTSIGADVNVEGMIRALAENVQHLTTAEISGGVLALRGTRANLTAAIDIEAGRQRMRTVTAPTGVIIDEGEMLVEQGTQVPIPVLSTDDRTTRSGVEFRRVGFSFVIKVRELSNGAVVDVEQTAGRLGRTVTIEENEVPSIEEEKLKTSLGLQPGLWYVVGGLKTESTDNEIGILKFRAKKETANIYLFLRVDPL